MAKVGKKYAEAVKLIEADKFYEPVEGIELVKKTATAKFDETIEIAFNLNVDPKYADQQVRGAVVLPHGTGKTQRVLVFAKGDKIKEAEDAGADIVGSEELVAKVQGGFSDFDLSVKHLSTMRNYLTISVQSLILLLKLNLQQLKVNTLKL